MYGPEQHRQFLRGFERTPLMSVVIPGTAGPSQGFAPMRVDRLRATIRLVRRTILIVDDHAPFRRAARALFEADGYQVVGEAADGRSAIEAASSLRPDIVLLDVQLPDLDGFEVARRMVDAGLSAAIVLTSTRDRASYRRRLAQSPARGFIPKSELVGAAIEELTA